MLRVGFSDNWRLCANPHRPGNVDWMTGCAVPAFTIERSSALPQPANNAMTDS